MRSVSPLSLTQPLELTKTLRPPAQDSHSKSSALSWVENHEETIEKTRKELEKLESRLATEEQEFEEIRDSLKGQSTPRPLPDCTFPGCSELTTSSRFSPLFRQNGRFLEPD